MLCKIKTILHKGKLCQKLFKNKMIVQNIIE